MTINSTGAGNTPACPNLIAIPGEFDLQYKVLLIIIGAVLAASSKFLSTHLDSWLFPGLFAPTGPRGATGLTSRHIPVTWPNATILKKPRHDIGAIWVMLANNFLCFLNIYFQWSDGHPTRSWPFCLCSRIMGVTIQCIDPGFVFYFTMGLVSWVLWVRGSLGKLAPPYDMTVMQMRALPLTITTTVLFCNSASSLEDVTNDLLYKPLAFAPVGCFLAILAGLSPTEYFISCCRIALFGQVPGVYRFGIKGAGGDLWIYTLAAIGAHVLVSLLFTPFVAYGRSWFGRVWDSGSAARSTIGSFFSITKRISHIQIQGGLGIVLVVLYTVLSTNYAPQFWTVYHALHERNTSRTNLSSDGSPGAGSSSSSEQVHYLGHYQVVLAPMLCMKLVLLIGFVVNAWRFRASLRSSWRSLLCGSYCCCTAKCTAKCTKNDTASCMTTSDLVAIRLAAGSPDLTRIRDSSE